MIKEQLFRNIFGIVKIADLQAHNVRCELVDWLFLAKRFGVEGIEEQTTVSIDGSSG